MKALVSVLVLAAAAAAQPAPEVRLPQYSRHVLPNGVVLDLVPHKGVPLTTVRVIVKGGQESDPADMAGLSSITAELLRRGTASRTADQFSEELDSLGATYYDDVDPQATFLSTEFLSKDAGKALDLLSDAVLHPSFPETEVAKALNERIDASRAMKDSPGQAAAVYFRAFFFGPAHPYGRPADEISLKRITRAAVVDYHARAYTGRNMVLIVAGDFDSAAMRSAIGKAFGQAPAGSAYRWQNADAPQQPEPRLLLVDKPDATQTYFRIGNTGITRTHPDRVAVWIVNTLFGGRFTSMLNDELRVNSGLTYGAGSRVDEDRLTGAIVISTYTRTDATERAIDIALGMLKRIREKGLTAEQLASAKAYLKGIFPTQTLETAGQLANVIGELELFGLDRGEIDNLFARIDGVTLEQANAAVQKHFGSGNLVFTLVGNASKIRDSVKKYAPQMIEIPVARPGFGTAK